MINLATHHQISAYLSLLDVSAVMAGRRSQIDCKCPPLPSEMNLANYAQAELTHDQSAFFALIWNNEVSNKVTHRVLSVRPAAEDKQGRPAIAKKLDVWPCSLLRYESCGPPRCEQKPCRSLWPVARLSKRTRTARSSPPQKACIYVRTLPRMTNAEALGWIHKRGRRDSGKLAKLNRLSHPALKTILRSNSSPTKESCWWLVLAKASLEARSGCKKRVKIKKRDSKESSVQKSLECLSFSFQILHYFSIHSRISDI